MGTEKIRATFTLSPAAIQLLSKVGNSSGYIDALILQHGREWTEAIALLKARGWSSADLLAACDALSGYGLASMSREGPFLAAELERAQERDKVFTGRGVLVRERNARIKQLRDDPALAFALATLVREYALNNQACRDTVNS